jgi:hypothetical protein
MKGNAQILLLQILHSHCTKVNILEDTAMRRGAVPSEEKVCLSPLKSSVGTEKGTHRGSCEKWRLLPVTEAKVLMK